MEARSRLLQEPARPFVPMLPEGDPEEDSDATVVDVRLLSLVLFLRFFGRDVLQGASLKAAASRIRSF